MLSFLIINGARKLRSGKWSHGGEWRYRIEDILIKEEWCQDSDVKNENVKVFFESGAEETFWFKQNVE